MGAQRLVDGGESDKLLQCFLSGPDDVGLAVMLPGRRQGLDLSPAQAAIAGAGL